MKFNEDGTNDGKLTVPKFKSKNGFTIVTLKLVKPYVVYIVKGEQKFFPMFSVNNATSAMILVNMLRAWLKELPEAPKKGALTEALTAFSRTRCNKTNGISCTVIVDEEKSNGPGNDVKGSSAEGGTSPDAGTAAAE